MIRRLQQPLDTDWGNLRHMPEYKAHQVIAVGPRHICAACEHVDARSRRNRAFGCVACGHADPKAVRIIRRGV